MKRRTAIASILAAGTGGGLLFSGYKWIDWHKTPDFPFLEQHRQLITALAETIIPTTDSPGAREAGVGDFILTMIKDCTDRISQNKFIDGLKDLDSWCKSRYNRSFELCSLAEKTETLSHFQEKGRPLKGIAGKAETRYLGKSFFTTLKEYTVQGYCSSEAGATKGLAYLYIPGAFHGCIPMQPGQRAWAIK